MRKVRMTLPVRKPPDPGVFVLERDEQNPLPLFRCCLCALFTISSKYLYAKKLCYGKLKWCLNFLWLLVCVFVWFRVLWFWVLCSFSPELIDFTDDSLKPGSLRQLLRFIFNSHRISLLKPIGIHCTFQYKPSKAFRMWYKSEWYCLISLVNASG